jgi:subtilisin
MRNPTCTFLLFLGLLVPASIRGAATVTVTNDLPVYIVTLHKGHKPKDVLAQHGLSTKHTYDFFGGFAASMGRNAVERLKNDPRVKFVEADGPVVPLDQTNGLGIIRMGITNFLASHITRNTNQIDVDVAVLDTGVDTNHPDLNVVHSFSSIQPMYGGRDHNGHGTHVAGIIGAKDNDFGVIGVAPGARIWNVQVLPPGIGSWSQILDGFDYVLQHSNEISIVNCSFGPAYGSKSPYGGIRAVIKSVVGCGIVVVGGAGNSTNDIAGPDGFFGVDPNTGTSDDFLPAALPEVMAVSAMDPSSDQFAPFSNFSGIPRTADSYFGNTNYVSSPGLAIDVAAPGVNILSTWTNGGYALLSGTSMATPHAAGAVALYIAINGRGHSASDVYRIRQAIVDGSLPQSRWNTNNTLDLDSYHEPLAVPATNWYAPPILTALPFSHNFMVGGSTLLNASAFGTPSIFYQWLKDGNALGNQTNTTLVLTNLQPSDAGAYSILASNAFGFALSSNALLALAPGTYPTSFYPINDLVAWYAFEGSSEDWSGYGSTGTASGGAQYASGALGLALSLDGTEGAGNYVQIPNSPAVGMNTNSEKTVSVRAYLKRRNTERNYNNSIIFSKYDGTLQGQEYYLSVLDSGNIRLTGQGVDVIDVGQFPLNEWHHLAFVMKPGASNSKVYMDGLLLASGSITYNPQFSSAPVFIGGFGPSSPYGVQGWNGMLDEFRVYNRALTDSEIAQLALLPPTPASPPTLLATRIGSNMILTWPTNASGFVLQYSMAFLSPTNWISLGTGITSIDGSSYVVTNTIDSDTRFYRLRK